MVLSMQNMGSHQRVAPAQSELKEWINAPPEGCCLESCDPVLQVRIYI